MHPLVLFVPIQKVSILPVKSYVELSEVLHFFFFFSSLDPKQCSYKLFGIGVTSISTNHQGLVDRNQSTPRLLTLVNACNAKAVLNSLKSFFFLVFLFLVFFRFSTCIDLIFLNSFSVLYLSSI